MTAIRFTRVAATLLVAACATTPIAKGPPSPLLAGTVAGKPISCLSPRTITDQRIVSESTILFRAGRWYRNDLRTACPGLDDRHTIIVRSYGSGTCEGDIFQVADLTSGTTYGSCSLGSFTPYNLPPGVR